MSDAQIWVVVSGMLGAVTLTLSGTGLLLLWFKNMMDTKFEATDQRLSDMDRRLGDKVDAVGQRVGLLEETVRTMDGRLWAIATREPVPAPAPTPGKD